MRNKLPTNWEQVPVMFDLPYACVLLGFSYDWLVRLARNGQIPAHKVGREWRFEKEELREWLKKQ